jgi:hypothetical protein
MYNSIIAQLPAPRKNVILKLKAKIIVWYLQKGVVRTKDNLAHQQWKGSL